MKKGDIVLIPFPFTDLSGIKTRPAVILCAQRSDITVAFITSQTNWQEEYDIKITGTDTNGLKKPSLIRLSKIATIDKDLVLGKLGELNAAQLKIINKNLTHLFNL